LLGPIFGSREYEKEVGIRAYDDEGKMWFCAMEHNVVIGCASFCKGVVSDCYVIPERRTYGVLTALLNCLIEKTSSLLKATCTPASKRIFERAGFVQKTAMKNFTKMELPRG
jgi:hypothetical protein